MARIPTVTARVSPLAGAPAAQASGADFGAGAGQALQGLGSTVTQIGGAVENIGAQRQADQDRIDAANEIASTSFAEPFNEIVDTYPDASGDGLVATAEEKYDAFAEDALAKTKLTGAARRAFELQLAQDKRIYLHRAAETASSMKTDNATLESTSGLDNIINDVRSNGLTTDVEYDNQLAKGLALLNAQPGNTAISRKAGEIQLKSDLAVAHFEALAEAATTELDVMALQDKIETPEWEDRLTKGHYDALKAHLQTTRNSIKDGTRTAIQSGLSSLTDRVNAGVQVPASEVAAVRDLITGAGNTATAAQLQTMREIEIRNDVNTNWSKLTPAQQRDKLANGVSGTPSNSGAPSGGTGSYKLTYVNQRSTRNRPVTRQLGSLYEQAAKAAGVTEVVVVSGGQPKAGEGGKRTGSTRHDHGHAGDIQLKVNGRTLDMTNPDDLKIMYRFVQEAWRLGATGIGANVSYMGSRTIHVGYGSKAVWGDTVPRSEGGRPPPRWLVEATSGIQQGGPTIDPVLQSVGSRYNLPATVLDGMWFAESSRGPGSVNPDSGAAGPFQFTPDTWAQYGQGGDINNFEDAADAAGRYMQDLLKQFGGNMQYALMAYNWGPGSVRTWIKEGSDPNAIPGETRDYVAKVMAQGGAGGGGDTGGGGGGGGGVSGTPAPGVPQGGYTHEQFVQMDALNILQKQQQAAINNDLIGFLQSQGQPVSGLSSPEDWVARDKLVTAATVNQELQANQIKPFSQAEMGVISQLMASGDRAAKAALYDGISNMSKANQDYAYKQIGETDKVAGYAGTLWGDNKPELALQALEGRDAMNAMKEQGALVWKSGAGGSDEYFRTTLNTPALRGLDPAVVDAMKGTADAIMAYRMNQQGIRDFDEGMYAEIWAEVLGKETAHVNGMDTVMPDGVDANQAQTVMSNMGANDWKMRSRTNTPPLDRDLQPLEGWQLSGAKLTVINGEDDYRVTIDEQPVLTVNPETGQPEAFVLHMEKEWVEDLISRTKAGYTPKDAERAVTGPQSGIGFAPSIGELTPVPTPEVPAEPAVAPTPSAAEVMMRNPAADYPTQAIPPGGSVVPSTARNPPLTPQEPSPVAPKPAEPVSPPETTRPVAATGAPANPSTPRERASAPRAQAVRARANEMLLDAYTTAVNGMKNLSDAQKAKMIEDYKRSQPAAENGAEPHGFMGSGASTNIEDQQRLDDLYGASTSRSDLPETYAVNKGWQKAKSVINTSGLPKNPTVEDIWKRVMINGDIKPELKKLLADADVQQWFIKLMGDYLASGKPLPPEIFTERIPSLVEGLRNYKGPPPKKGK